MQGHLLKVPVPLLLTANKARESLKNIDGWQLTDDHKMIYREFILHHFMDAIDLIDRIALIAEDEKHHPDIHLTQCRNLRVALTSHDAGGLSEKDITVAKKINDLSTSVNKPDHAVALNQQLKDHKDKPIKRSRVVQKKVQPKKRQGVDLVLKKKVKVTKVVQAKRSFNIMDNPTQRT